MRSKSSGRSCIAKIVGRALRRPGHAGLLVGAEQGALALLADVDLARIVGGVDDFAIEAREFGDRVGNDVMVLHGEHGKLQAHHAADLARPQAAAVDDVLGVDAALVGLDVPGQIRTLADREHAGEPIDFRPELAGRCRIGLGGPGRVEVAAVGPPQGAGEELLLKQTVESLGFLDRDDLGVHPEIASPAADQVQRIHLALVCGQHQPAVRVQPAGQAREVLELAVEVDGVFLQARDVGVAVEGVHAAGGVPGGAGGEFALLDQHHVRPADLGQMVENADPDDAAPDHHRTCLGSHRD